MRHAVTFGAMASTTAVAAAIAPWVIVQAPLAWVALSLGLASAAYAGAGPRVLGKRSDGVLPAWSLVVNGPFLLFGLVSMRLFHRVAGEGPWHEVADNLWLGRRPSGSDREIFAALRARAVLDLCAELPRSRALTGAEAYLTLPVLDSEAPTAEQLDAAVAWIEAHREHGPVMVHCALGHSRSASVVAAWMLARKVHRGDLDDLERALKRVRRSVWFTGAQKKRLLEWSRRLADELQDSA